MLTSTSALADFATAALSSPSPPHAIFKFGHDDLLRSLPEKAFLGGDDSGDDSLSLTAVSNTIGMDGLVFTREIEQELRRAFDLEVVAQNIESRRRLLRNVRKWALEGLRDESLVVALSHPLPSPSLTEESSNGAPSPPTLASKKSRCITARQARSVLANAFLRNINDVMKTEKDPSNCGGLDFRRLFMGNSGDCGSQKLACLLLYFEACGSILEDTEDDDRVITFERIRYLPSRMDSLVKDMRGEKGKHSCGRFIGDGVHLHSGPMESPPRPAGAFVNFANPNFGYGKCIPSATQEEIMQMCCPEFNVGMLFIGKMGDDEVVNVCSVRRFCQYSGFLDSFMCKGLVPHLDRAASLETVMTMDACTYSHFSKKMIQRDICKAYHCFREYALDSLGLTAESSIPHQQYPIISTGKWGCGVFGGRPAHKLVQQACAANLAGVDLQFSTFHNDDGCSKVLAALQSRRLKADDVLPLLYNGTDYEHFFANIVGDEKKIRVSVYPPDH
uniref:poly(ADP-ribose) glycohydrolase n=1 Tax=Corethron hystrix TaxID=216773 RepID=A0A7S1BAR9_9STRA